MSEENKYTFENPEYRDTYRHTVSHILAQAVKRLYPEVKLAIGPAIENGFYYDFDAPFSFTQEHLDALEAEMKKICKEKLPLERFELPRAEARKLMEEKDEPYKVQLIDDLPEDATISFYKQGDFTDLCAGPHLDSTGRVKGNGIKLMNVTGAYWRGDSNNKMLQRIYGTAFPKKDELDPTGIMTVFYVFLFGLMLSDAAYGAIISSACGAAILKFPRMEESLKKSLQLFFWCGLSTLFWGIMFGGYFGDALDVIAKTFFGVSLPEGQSVIPALWFVPLNDPMRLLMYSLLFGCIHLFTGLGI